MKINHIAASLDLTSTDDFVLQYINMLLGIYPKIKVECTHVTPVFDLATALYTHDTEELEATAERRKLVEEDINEKIVKFIDNNFHDNVYIHVNEGKVLDKLVYYAGESEHDLLVLGRKKNKDYFGRLTHELIRRGKSNTLLVPEKPPITPRRILVPIDFSDNAIRAYETAVELANSLPNMPEVHCINVYELPDTDTLYAGFKPRSEEFKTEMKKAVSFAYHTFLEKAKVELRNEKSATFTALNAPRTLCAEAIFHHANTFGADLIIMGVKGHSDIERFFLGSVVERMTLINHKFPLLLVK